MSKKIITEINKLASQIDREITLMELCGTHTETVARHGIKKLLPKNIKLLSGPGCPVCVTDQRDINAIITLALNNIPIACYGDVLRVPGTLKTSQTVIARSEATKQSRAMCNKNGIATPCISGARNDSVISLSLDKARELGADIIEIYSVEDALELQKKSAGRRTDLVFFGLGFETTAPMTASAIKRGLTVYSSHKAFVPAMAAILNTPQLKIDGFINPGHVSAIIGTELYKQFHLPQVITGFEANDVLMAIYMLLKQIVENRAEAENQYTRLVRQEGNPKAMKLINEVFETGDAFWRGIGKISNSSFEIRQKYSQFDAKIKYKDILFSLKTKDYKLITESGCICGAILRGLKQPKDCKLFNKKCTPENPIGACMVSSEGACGIEAKFKE